MAALLHELLIETATRTPDARALAQGERQLRYSELAVAVQRFAASLLAIGLKRHERVAVYLDKRPQTVVALFGAVAAGGTMVPVNPLLKSGQVSYILSDCNVRVLVTSSDRLKLIAADIRQCRDLHAVVLVDSPAEGDLPGVECLTWEAFGTRAADTRPPRLIDSDLAAILYTSGSTGRPKGVVLSHRNVVTGAFSVAQYLEISASDRILSVLPLSFDYGLNQLTTAFYRGATAILLNYLLPRDVVAAVARHGISGLAAVPPLWIQLAQLEWPPPAIEHLRYITNSGGKMPRPTLDQLRRKLPGTRVFLMYGLTEAFRSTYLPPEEVDRRPESMGKAIPNAEILVVREDGSPCAPGEPGELVHRGPLVSLGYWNDAERTAERFRPTPNRVPGIMIPEIAVWSGDTVRADEDGYLYFVGRRDDMIKSSGYRISPSEVEEVIYGTGLVAEVAAIGVPHAVLGQAVVAVVMPRDHHAFSRDALLAECKQRLPAFMVPLAIETRPQLERNPNGKIDRKKLACELESLFEESEDARRQES
jgi:acyl-CoA ligase (AMP-forming) (exosortase A-associated)